MKPAHAQKEKLRQIKLIVFDFDGVFTDNKVIISEDGKESVVCDRSDGLGLSKLRKAGVDLLILSTEPNSVVKQRAKKLKIDCINACESKLKTMRKILQERKIDPRHVAFMGNDTNDLECLQSVGVPVIVADSHKDIMKKSFYKTGRKGGKGAVREICDLIYALKTEGK